MSSRKDARGCENSSATSAVFRMGWAAGRLCKRAIIFSMNMECAYTEREVQDKSDDSVTLLAVSTCVKKWERRTTYGVTIRSFEARNGSRTHSKGSFCLSLGSPIYNESKKVNSLWTLISDFMARRTSSNASRLCGFGSIRSSYSKESAPLTAVSSIVLSSKSTLPPGNEVSPA